MAKRLLVALPLIFILMATLGFSATYDVYPSDDAQVQSNHATTNYGSGNLEIGYTDLNNYYRSFLKFNLSAYPAVNITDVKLYYYGTGSQSDGYMELYGITNGFNWSEDTLTWNLQPAINSTKKTYYCVQDDGGAGNDCYWGASIGAGTEYIANVTAFVLNELAISGNDVTLLFRYETNNHRLVVASKENGNTNYHPFLRIDYNGTPIAPSEEAPVTVQVSIPSYPAPSNTLQCWANITSSEPTTIASWYIARKLSTDSTYNVVATGDTNITQGVLSNVGNLSGYYVVSNASYYCAVKGKTGSGTEGNLLVSNTATAGSIGNIVSVSVPSTVNLDDSATTSVVTENLGTSSVYGYVECNYLSPSSVNYYPNQTTNPCQLIDTINDLTFYPSRLANESGTWSVPTCALYISNASSCPLYDLSLHELYYTSYTFDVADAPRVSTVYVTPTSPTGDNDLKCYATLTGNSSTIDVDYIWMLGTAGWKFGSTTVSNNTLTLIDTLSASSTEAGDTFSCSVRGHVGSAYGSYVESSSVTVRSYRIENITTSEPTLFGDVKSINFNSERNVISAKLEVRKPSGSTFSQYISTPIATKNFTSAIFSGFERENFNEIGTYLYTLKACNCPTTLMDNPSLCPDDQCAYPSDYPTKSRAMVFGTTDNYYLYDVTVPTIERFGTMKTFSSRFSKATNAMRLKITYPDATTQYFTTIIGNSTAGEIVLTSGTSGQLDQVGAYTADFEAGYGWISGNQTCIPLGECDYQNTSTGNSFTLSYDDVYIDNLTISPSPIYYGTDVNMSFDVTNETDGTCVYVYFPSGNFKHKYMANTTTDWMIPFTTGDGMFLNEQGDFNMTILSCKRNGTATCLDSSCTDNRGGYSCLYCAETDVTTLGILETGVFSVAYNSPIKKNCEDLTINFTANPAVSKVGIRFATTIYGNREAWINFTQPVETYNWTVSVPYSEIEQVICNTSGETTICSYGQNGFWITLADDAGDFYQSQFYYFTIDKEGICPLGSKTGTDLGCLVGNGIGTNCVVGDMVFALFVSVVLAVIAGIFSSGAFTGMSSNSHMHIIVTLVFVASISVFSIARMMPVWIPIILIVFAGFLIVKTIGGAFGSGGG